MRKTAWGMCIFVMVWMFSLTGCNEVEYFKWHTIKPGGKSICGNGSEYKFFVNPSNKSKNVLIYFEAGGACWDFPSCSGQAGIRGAANPNGLPDDYMSGIPAIMSPFTFRNHPWDSLPTKKWTIIFVPYCTGDVHTGNNVKTYSDPTGRQADLEWHHNGHENVKAVIKWMKTQDVIPGFFDDIPKLVVTGCSAGGIGSLVNYHFIRQELGDRVGEAILLNDSGPAYLAEDKWPEKNSEEMADLDVDGLHSYEKYPHSLPMHKKIREAWNLDSILNSQYPAPFNESNFGTISDMLAYLYPNDKLGHTQFTRDANYSSYSYERFYQHVPGFDIDHIHVYWSEDQHFMMGQYDKSANLGYFIPYYRPFNESHCTCVFDFTDTDIDEVGMDVKDYIVSLLGDGQIQSHYENPDPEELNKPYWGWELINLLMEAL